MNVNEYGNVIRVWLKEDISTSTNTLILSSPKPQGTDLVITAADGLTVGTAAFDDGNGSIFIANEYLEYVIKENDINKVGTWSIRTTSLKPSGEYKITDNILTFKVHE